MRTNILAMAVVFVVVLISMIFHELAHGFMAYFLGDDMAKEEGRLTLNPLKHLDPLLSVALPLLLFMTGGPIFGGAKPVPVNSKNLKYGVWGMAMVAVAGPLMNFVIAFVAFLVGYYTGWLEAPGLIGVIFDYLVLINLGFGVFNLIPIPPLDGSRVLYAIAPDGVREAMSGMEKWGIMVVLLLVVVFPSFISMIMGGAMEGILRFFFWIVGVH